MPREQIRGLISSKYPQLAPQPAQEGGFIQEQRQRGAEMANLDYSAQQPIEQGGVTRPEAQIRKVGQFAGGITDAVGKGMTATFHALMTDKGEERLSNDLQRLAATPVGQAGIEAIQKGGELYGEFKKNNPRAAGLLEAGANIAGVLPLIKGLSPAVESVATTAPQVPVTIESALKKISDRKSRKIPVRLLSDIQQRGVAGANAFTSVREKIQAAAKKETQKLFGITNLAGDKVKEGLFDIAEKRGAKAFMPAQPWQQLSEQLDNRIGSVVGQETKEMLAQTSKLLKQLTTSEGGINAQGVINRAARNPSLNELQGIRRQLSAISNSGGREAAEAKNLLNTFDDLIVNNSNKIIGDKGAAKVWDSAIKGRREYALKFEKPNEIAKALTDASNEKIEQVFIGSGGASLNKDMSKVYNNTLKLLPPKDRGVAGFQMRQSVINRMIKNSLQSTDSEDGISAARLSNQIRNFRNDNPSMWAKFTDIERRELSALENSLRKTSQGDVVNKVYKAMGNIINRSLKTNIELPRTLKPKTVVSVEDLIEMTKVKPKKTYAAGALLGSQQGE
jgi:hypothetical protein